MTHKVVQERATLPLHLKNEVPVVGSEKRTIKRFQIPDLNPFLKNQEQILFLMPEEQAKMTLLQRRLAKIAFDALPANE